MTLWFDDMVKNLAAAKKDCADVEQSMRLRTAEIHAQTLTMQSDTPEWLVRAWMENELLKDPVYRELVDHANRCRAAVIDAEAEIEAHTLNLRLREVEAHESNITLWRDQIQRVN